ncbi:MAG: bifunctional diaminohydroxyphosphoribosylaminopyrimidine deaminase/5-amino-6-(5-phosphoribosylamino)uracil reductase RibD [Eubacteriaceae bacterium]|nr:bifunctional diaminohydroxyphosphoribosylaminopyrimidine deaminase/5-amino-6-(5-phosphoribosylamino)uracil reductase RibD [Eubacteriaceae bacterium]
MKRALELAEKGEGCVNPNPLVGAVVVKNGKIIGEGYHEYCGGAHAEINAFRDAGRDLAGSTLYVTLEPCSHHGRTPPCAEAIVKNKIAEVVIGMKDPNPLVSGSGIKILSDNGIKVRIGVLEEEARRLNEIFIKFITWKRPFCLMKTAMTLDGKIATETGESRWISNEQSRAYVHEIRNKYAAIMVGIGTVLKDDPSLTCRQGEDEKEPVRIIIDSNLRIPLTAKVLNCRTPSKTIIAAVEGTDPEGIKRIEEKGAKVMLTPPIDGRVDFPFLMDLLGKENIDSILLEGGAELNYSALKSGIVDKVISFIAPKIIGGRNAPTPVGGKGVRNLQEAFMFENIKVKSFGDDVMIEGYPIINSSERKVE